MDPKLSDDLLTGVPAIANELGEPEWRVYSLLTGGHIHAFKMLGKWTTTRILLELLLEELTDATATRNCRRSPI